MPATAVTSYCRAAGLLLFLTILGGWFGEMYVPSLMMGPDAAATAANLRADDGLFRLGFAAYLVEAVSDIILIWLFYLLLRPVHRDLALLAAFFGLVSMTLFAVTKMFYFSAPVFLRGGDRLAAIPPEQLEALASAFLSLYGALNGLTMLFYGIAWLIRGWLTFRSLYLPQFLGVLMIAAGFGFVTKTLTHVVEPAWSANLLLAPMFLNLLVLAFWMLVKGVDREKWERACAAPAGCPA